MAIKKEIEGMKKMCFCPVALAAALLVALFLASCSNAPGVPPNVDPMPGIGTPTIPTPVTPGSEILQSAHAKVEKVAGGLKFTVKQPSAAGFKYEYARDGNGNIVYDYNAVVQGEGNCLQKVENVGDGNGSYNKSVKYFPVQSGKGNFEANYEAVGAGMGTHKKNENGEYVWEAGGGYQIGYEYVGEGNGSYVQDVVYYEVGAGNGSYNFLGYEYVGQGKGNFFKNARLLTPSGWSNVLISTSGGLSNGCVQVSLDLTEHKDELTLFWPLCEPGKLCEYEIQILPFNDNLRGSTIYEKLVVAAKEGIGEIEKAPKHSEVILSYDGQKPTVKAEGLESPAGKIQNLKTKCHFFATNQSQLKDGSVDWRTDYAVSWICGYSVPGVVDEFVWDDAKYWDSRTFNEIFDATGKDTLYTTWNIQFDLPELSGLDVWVFVLDGKKNLLKIR